MNCWRGKIALVTGASSGIGAALCCSLVKAGFKVIGAARNADKIQELKQFIDEKDKGNLVVIKCDLTKDEEVFQMFKDIKNQYEGVDVCINNAGMNTHHTLLDGTTSSWRNILDLNVVALCLCTKLSIASMRERNVDDGHIININSVYGHQLQSRETAHFYMATKHTVRAITEGFRQELRALKSHIRVSSVSPGVVQTEFAMREMGKADAESFYNNFDSTLSADDVASSVMHAIAAPKHVDVNEIIIRPV